jgi:hypothetical protein
MGSSTDWGSEAHHSDYENYIRDRTTGYVSGEFDPYLEFDGSLVELEAYEGALDVGFVSTFGDGGDVRDCVWMDGNYDWSDPAFRLSAGVSLNLAVNVLADVLHSIAVIGVQEVDPPVVITGSVSGRVVGEDGGALEGAWVRLKEVGSGDVVDTEITGQNGMFGFDDVGLGDYRILVTSEGYMGYETGAFSVSEVAQTVDIWDIELERGPSVEKGGSVEWMWIGVLVGVIVVVVVGILLGSREVRGEEE